MKSSTLQRVAAVDVFRALTMFFMLFVNDIPGLKNVPHWLMHAEMNEDMMGFSDTIFPAFLFCMGMSIPFAIQNRVKKGDTALQIISHISERTVALIAMGLFMLNCSDVGSISYQWFSILMVIGFFLIWNVYPHTEGPGKYVFKGMRKKPELMARIFAKLGKEILAYMKLAKEQGADFISYADSSGGVNILGPKMAEQMVNLFTYDFVKQAGKLADEHTMILLCPKTTFALLGTGKAKLIDCQIHDDRSQEEDSLSYAEACIRMKGKIRFAGQMCIKNLDYRMKNGIMKEVHIL